MDPVPAWTWLAVAVGLTVRMWFSRTSGIYLDEAQVLGVTAQPDLPSILRFLARHEAHPPGYYLLLRAWREAFGSSDDVAIALSLVAGTLSIPFAFFFVSRLTDSMEDANAAAWLVALSPTAVRYSGM